MSKDAEIWASVARKKVRALEHTADSLALQDKKKPKGN